MIKRDKANFFSGSSVFYKRENGDWDAIADPDKIIIFHTSPPVRVGSARRSASCPSLFLQGKIAAALRTPGADYALDANFSADLTIMKEASELADRVTHNKPLP
ncbi:MAG: hypothetical protein LBG43_02605 [Treponema sp.]|nr:hypothetical protein [Treponema sp.]